MCVYARSADQVSSLAYIPEECIDGLCAREAKDDERDFQPFLFSRQLAKGKKKQKKNVRTCNQETGHLTSLSLSRSPSLVSDAINAIRAFLRPSSPR